MPRVRARVAGDNYLELVKQFPLRRLRGDAEHRQAVRFLTQTSLAHQKSRDGGVRDYLEMLAHIIDEYEQAAGLKMALAHADPASVVRHLMVEHRLTISGLAREIGIGQSNLSEMLSGRREFSKVAIGGLCERFGLEAGVFF